MMVIIGLTGNTAFYRHHILQATASIDDNTPKHDAQHRLYLTEHLALSGDEEAKRILYDIFENNCTQKTPLGAGSIIRVDRIQGFLYVLNRLGDTVINEDVRYQSDNLLRVLEREIGAKSAIIKLEKYRSQNKLLDTYLQRIDTVRQKDQEQIKRNKKRKPDPRITKPYSEIKSELQSGRFFPAQWAQHATEADLKQAAEDLLQQNDPKSKSIYRYLNLFRDIDFPFHPSLLFRFIDFEHDIFSMPTITVNILKRLKHPAVRQFGLHLIRQNKHSAEAINLLVHNFKEHDWVKIQAVGHTLSTRADYHTFGFAIQDVFEENPSEQGLSALRLAFEKTPCSYCRLRILKQLNDVNALTNEILNESLFDANIEVREWAVAYKYKRNG
ncbi:MAG: hypothetical protein AAFV93_21675 [Chloroflexota bacterium]